MPTPSLVEEEEAGPSRFFCRGEMKAPAEAKTLAVKIIELSFMMAVYIYILVFSEYSL
jgi:hypothetical protein